MKVKALKGYAYFEQGIVITLLALMMVVILFATIAFVVVTGREMIDALRTATAQFTLRSY